LSSNKIINHPVPEIGISIDDYIWISGPPLLEKRKGEVTNCGLKIGIEL